MNKSIFIWGLVALVLLFGVSFFSSSEQTQPPEVAITTNPLPKGARILGLDVTAAKGNDFDAALEKAREAGAETVPLSVNWNSVETGRGVYNANPNWLAIANSYYPPKGISVALTIRPIDTNGRQIPEDLKDLPFNHPEVVRRFKAFLDYVFSQTRNLEIVSLAIGNEVDSGLGSNPEAWKQYEEFYRQAVAYAKSQRPDVPYGVTASLYGLVVEKTTELGSLNNFSDAIMVTYYPLDADLRVKSPTVVQSDLDALVDRYPGKSIHLREAGYPSSRGLGSSEERQAQFIGELFRAWDRHASQIGHISFSWLTDRSPTELKDLEKYYGLAGGNFREYLGTLGLRRHNGTDKPGFVLMGEEAQARGWR